MASNVYGATSLTGGGAGALDKYDGANLADLDLAFVVTLAYVYVYSLDADSAAAESSPDVISPDANPGNKRWILTGINEVTATELSQLKTLGATTISAAQWAHLGGLNTTAKARAYLNSAQDNIADITPVKVLLDGETYDVGNNFASNKFTAPTTGYYAVSWGVGFKNIIATKQYQAVLYVDGSSVNYATGHSSTTNEIRVGGSDVIYLTAAQYIELYVYINVGAATVDLENDSRMTYLAVHFLGA